MMAEEKIPTPDQVTFAAERNPGGVVAWQGLVLICYGSAVTLTPSQARDLAATLVVKARLAELQQANEAPPAGLNEELGTVD